MIQKNKYSFPRIRAKQGNYQKICYAVFNDHVEKINKIADENQVSRSFVINRALEEYFQEYQGSSDTNAEK